MGKWQRLAVHADRDQRIAPIERQLDRKAACPAVDTGAEQLLGAGLDARLFEQRAKRHALPHGVADVLAADLIADAAQRHHVLDLRERLEIGIGVADRLVDHAVDAQAPRGRIDAGQRECGIDSVELVIARDERCHTA